MQQVSRVAYNYETKLFTITSTVSSSSSNSSASFSSSATSKTWDAEHVICTVPLGVLKGLSISFEPALSSDFITALDSLGMGNLVRVTLLFDTVWWDSRDNFFLLSRPEFGAAQRGLFTYFLNGRMLLNGRPVLVAFSSGEAASSAEGLSDAETWALIRDNLVAMFGAAVPANYRGMMRSLWAADPWAKGTHSYPTTAASRYVWGSLQQKQGGTLFFAGEHTSPKYYGTLHGAIQEGLRAARALMDEARVFKEQPTYGTGSSSGTALSAGVPVQDWSAALVVCVASALALALAHTHEFM